MKRSLKLFAMLVLSFAVVLLSACKGNEHEQTTADITPPTMEETDSASGTTKVPTVETEQPTTEPVQKPDPVTVEWLAGELMRRKYVSCIELELVDYSDIMDRNEDTDLFFYDNQLMIDRIKLDRTDSFSSVDSNEIEVQQIINETDAEITADLYVSVVAPSVDPRVGEYIGEIFRITVDKQRMVIIAYTEPNVCSTRYKNRLEPLAMRYRNQGMSWEEADKRAYDDIFAEYVADATEWPRSTP